MKKTLITILIIIAGWQLQAQSNVEAWAKLDSASIMIGDQIGMQLGISVPGNFVVEWPQYVDTVTAHIEVIKKHDIDTTRKNGNLILSQLYTITSFDSGYFEIPPAEFRFHPVGDTSVKYTANTNTLFLNVTTPMVDTTKAFKPIVGPVSEPYTFAEIFPWVLLGLVIIGGIFFLIWYYRRKKKDKPLFVRRPKPALPPDVEAIQNLEELRLAKVWQQGKLKEYYTQLTDIMRHYFERRYGFDAPEMTSDEILDRLMEEKVNDQAFGKMKDVLQLADLVKFAKAQPAPLENDLSLNHCIDFVKETKPAPVAQPETSGDEGETKEEETKKENE
ncbi:MAG: hypothetical protein GXO86_10335 [Chlorobi bacterium]|nr:hypothetical protein [Chlorobiota bacterium]